MSSEPPDYRHYYSDHRPRWLRLLDEVHFIVEAALPVDVHIHSKGGRVKERSSFLGKIERKGYTSQDQVEDMVGYRIVCLSLGDLEIVQSMVRESFEVLREEDKIEQVDDASSFGYMSKHYICRLRRELKGPRYEGIKQYKFEIQCRTILMDAWANVSHHLAYKGDASIPDQLQRDFYALSGLFYVADRHFELFFKAALTSEQSALSAQPQDLRNAPMNLDTVQAMLSRMYPNRSRANRGEISAFVEEAASVGYDTLGKLEEALSKGGRPGQKYEADLPPALMGGEKYSNLGFARMALAIADPRYAKKCYPDERRFEEYRKGL